MGPSKGQCPKDTEVFKKVSGKRKGETRKERRLYTFSIYLGFLCIKWSQSADQEGTKEAGESGQFCFCPPSLLPTYPTF